MKDKKTNRLLLSVASLLLSVIKEITYSRAIICQDVLQQSGSTKCQLSAFETTFWVQPILVDVHKQNNAKSLLNQGIITVIWFPQLHFLLISHNANGKIFIKTIFGFLFVTRDGAEEGAGCECGEAADHKPRQGAVGKRSVNGFPLVYL